MADTQVDSGSDISAKVSLVRNGLRLVPPPPRALSSQTVRRRFALVRTLKSVRVEQSDGRKAGKAAGRVADRSGGSRHRIEVTGSANSPCLIVRGPSLRGFFVYPGSSVLR